MSQIFREEIDPNRTLFLARTSEGWIIAKCGKFNMTFNENNEFLRYELLPSIFYMSKIPQELVDKLISYIPTEEQLDDKEYIDFVQPRVLDYFG